MNARSQQPDETLVRSFQRDASAPEGRAAAAELLDRYAERVYLWCFRILREHEAALDAAQEVAIEVLSSLHQFRGESLFSTWIFSVTRHRCWRLKRRASLFTEEVDPDTLATDGSPVEREIESSLDEDALLALMRDALEPAEATALWLRCVEGVTVDDLTRMLELTNASGARGLLQTARRKLRAVLVERERAERRGERRRDSGGEVR